MQAGDLVGLAFAGAAGFAVCKLLEADAHGVPWQLALKNPHRSVMLLRAKLDASGPQAKEALEGLSGGSDAAWRSHFNKTRFGQPNRSAGMSPFGKPKPGGMFGSAFAQAIKKGVVVQKVGKANWGGMFGGALKLVGKSRAVSPVASGGSKWSRFAASSVRRV